MDFGTPDQRVKLVLSYLNQHNIRREQINSCLQITKGIKENIKEVEEENKKLQDRANELILEKIIPLTQEPNK